MDLMNQIDLFPEVMRATCQKVKRGKYLLLGCIFQGSTNYRLNLDTLQMRNEEKKVTSGQFKYLIET